MENKKITRMWEISFFLLIFIGIFTFFTKAHLLVPYDGDDWAGLSLMRNAIPIWKGWNPIKILPEDLFSLLGTFSAYITYPLVGDYVYSIAITSAALFGLLVCVYIYLFCKLMQSWLSLSTSQSILTTTLFFILHFCLFYKKDAVVPYLFGTVNLTCLYHYIIPAVVNLCVVFYLARFDLPHRQNKSLTLGKGSILILAIYLAIFSNVLSNIILASYVICILLMRFLSSGGYRKNLKGFFKDNRLYVAILILWIIALLFEANGGRAHSIGKGILSLPVPQTLKLYTTTVAQISKSVAIFAVVMVGVALYIRRRISDIFYYKIGILYIGISVISFAYLILVCAKAEPGYIARSDVFISLIIWTVLFICFTVAYILRNCPNVTYVLPIFLLYFTMQASVGVGSYLENTMGHVNPKICYQIDNEIIQQVKDADQAGQSEMTLLVPKGDNKDNWPHPMYMGGNLSRTLHKHGIISKPMKITIQPDSSINEKYHIAIPK